MNLLEDRVLVRQTSIALVMMATICCMLVYRFTTQSAIDRERVRARTTLETIHQLQQSYFDEYGTYLSSDRGNTSDILRWDDIPGAFEYIVLDHGDTYVALAEADLDGDGDLEIWRVDPRHPDPVLVQSD
jgi:type II secretory pathway pseudopilin PulG